MKILALIPARGGSKRVVGKNIRPLGGKPLINWSIEVAQGIPEICDILVSTDDQTIASTASDAGALVPWLRPIELAADSANSVEVALHALEWYESYNGIVDGLLLLQPTSPFRTRKTINEGIKLFSESNNQSVLGISLAREHPMWALKIENGVLVPFSEESGLGVPSQDLPKAFMPNGSLYLISPSELRTTHSFTGSRILPIISYSEKESLDIDTEWDFTIAEKLAFKNHEI